MSWGLDKSIWGRLRTRIFALSLSPSGCLPRLSQFNGAKSSRQLWRPTGQQTGQRSYRHVIDSFHLGNAPLTQTWRTCRAGLERVATKPDVGATATINIGTVFHPTVSDDLRYISCLQWPTVSWDERRRIEHLGSYLRMRKNFINNNEPVMVPAHVEDIMKGIQHLL